MRIMIVVTHLLGAGHLRRALNLSLAFREVGHEVMLVSGGVPIPQFSAADVSLVQLPAVRSDGVSFTSLLQPDGRTVSRDYLAARQSQLVDLLQRYSPDVLITELFPFGRRILKQEFTALLQTAAALTKRPVILSSVRDILSAPSTAEKALETERVVHKFYDGVLVHADQHTTPLDLSWPVTQTMLKKLRYTGYVAQPLDETSAAAHGRKEILVSAGSGSVGSTLFDTTITAAGLVNGFSWRMLVGGADAVSEIDRLNAMASNVPAVTIEPARRDFRQLLQGATCSVSMCGYNTAVDLLQTGTPGVLVPFDAGGETEQRIRASSLSKHPAYRMVLSQDLTPETLIQATTEVQQAGRFVFDSRLFDGAAESVRIAEQLAIESARG